MEGNFAPETPHQPTLPSAPNLSCDDELTRSNSDASSLMAENCEDKFRRLEDATPVDPTAWTDEKHNLYLHHLEVSFVKQLHQSKHLLANCSEQNQKSINVAKRCLNNVNNASEQFNVLRNGCGQKIDFVRGEPLSSSTSADSQASVVKSKWMCNGKRMGMHRRPPSSETPEFLKLCSTVKHGKRIIFHCLATCSKEPSSEGMGQNFLNENNQITSNTESLAKRLKTAGAGSSSQDQIVPLRKCPTDLR